MKMLAVGLIVALMSSIVAFVLESMNSAVLASALALISVKYKRKIS